ncbi:MAG: tryptophan--tRNA ligase [Gammaproteobacteria bacterium]|nr:tryptophan--tRNA ligase [Gammaproteobacteria bacterium]
MTAENQSSETQAHKTRVLSGMRPTGRLHLGHYRGVLMNWAKLQNEYDSYFMVADWHALTTSYDEVGGIKNAGYEMVIDWLASGIDPDKSAIFLQSQVVEHAELHLLLSMVTPLGWLERVPTYKEQQEKLSHKDLTTYGFLGYPLLQAVDILVYKAGLVPVGADQVPHIEFSREIARRFNHMYGRDPRFMADVEAGLALLDADDQKRLNNLGKRYREQGEAEALDKALKLVRARRQLSEAQRSALEAQVHGTGRQILPEPQALLTAASKMPGLDGQKMSKSYGNTIALREKPADVETKIKKMPTDPARVRRTDPGNPDNCPVWQLHEIYSGEDVKAWVRQGCTSAGIGCIECKMPVVEAVNAELKPIQERAAEYERDPELVKRVLKNGCERARAVTADTMADVRAAMGLDY